MQQLKARARVLKYCPLDMTAEQEGENFITFLRFFAYCTSLRGSLFQFGSESQFYYTTSGTGNLAHGDENLTEQFAACLCQSPFFPSLVLKVCHIQRSSFGFASTLRGCVEQSAFGWPESRDYYVIPGSCCCGSTNVSARLCSPVLGCWKLCTFWIAPIAYVIITLFALQSSGTRRLRTTAQVTTPTVSPITVEKHHVACRTVNVLPLLQ